jgi:hypothetical protein
VNEELEQQGLARGLPGETRGKLEVATKAENKRAAIGLARQARSSLDIVSRSLDPPVFDQLDFVNAVRHIVLNNPRARIRLLISDPDPVVRFGHRLLILAAQLPSFIEARVPGEDAGEVSASWMTVDDKGYIYRERAEGYEAVVSFDDPVRARRLRRELDALWETAVPDPNLRQLKI